MDSLTQVVLGSSVAALVTPPSQRRAAILVGAALGTLPDLDTLWLGLAGGGDIITEVTWHRGPSHSLPVLALIGWLLWWLIKSYTPLVKKAPIRWLWAFWLALLTHPLLDAFTVYGTQLLWPLPVKPTMWATIFVIDPLYTVPLIVGVIAAWLLAPGEKLEPVGGVKPKSTSSYWLLAGLVLSSAYLAWSAIAKYKVDQIASQRLTVMGLEDMPRFSTPLPLNTLLWRVIVMAPNGYWIGDRSFIADHGAMSFTFYPSDTLALEQLKSDPQVERLTWFSQGFISAQTQQQDNGELHLILADLRMGFEPDYFYRYDVARLDDKGDWVVLPSINRVPNTADPVKTLKWVWQRIHNNSETE